MTTPPRKDHVVSVEIPVTKKVYHSVTFCGDVYFIPEDAQKLANESGFAVIIDGKRYEPVY